MLEGEVWERQRRTTAPAYTSKQLAGYCADTLQVVQDLARQWEGQSEIDTRAEGMRLWARALARIFCGRDVDEKADQLLGPIRNGLDGAGVFLRSGMPLPLWIPLPHVTAIRRGRDALQKFGEELLSSHIEDANSRGRLASQLLSDSRDAAAQIRARDDLAGNIAVGGHQMMTAFCWTLFCLCENPAIQDEPRSSLRSGPIDPTAWLDNELLTWVVKESLRLYPPFYLIPRLARRDVEIGGYRIVKGELVLLSPWVTQRSAIYYADPDVFRPERWRGKSDEASRFEHFPFGGGPRACVAGSSIPPLLSVAIAALVRNHRVVRVDSDPIVPLAGMSLSMSRPLVVRLERTE